MSTTIVITRHESGVEKSTFTVEDGELNFEAVNDFIPGRAYPTWTLMFPDKEKDLSIEFDAPKKDVIEEARELCSDMVMDNQLEEIPEELQE